VRGEPEGLEGRTLLVHYFRLDTDSRRRVVFNLILPFFHFAPFFFDFGFFSKLVKEVERSINTSTNNYAFINLDYQKPSVLYATVASYLLASTSLPF